MAHFTFLSDLYDYPIEAKNWQLFDEGMYELHDQNNPKEAIKYFQEALKQLPQNISYLAELTNAYEKAGMLAQASATVTKILSYLDKNDDRYEGFVKKHNALKSIL